nr:hypothetical protein JVH1_7443 [Rhodococcus sp. JVH1]
MPFAVRNSSPRSSEVRNEFHFDLDGETAPRRRAVSDATD